MAPNVHPHQSISHWDGISAEQQRICIIRTHPGHPWSLPPATIYFQLSTMSAGLVPRPAE